MFLDPDQFPFVRDLEAAWTDVRDECFAKNCKPTFATFKQKLEIPRELILNNTRSINWTQSLTLPPGLYQVRFAVRDRQTGRTGSAMAWIEIPSN